MYFPLHPDTPSEGRRLEQLFAGHGIDLDAAHPRMTALMRAEGLEYTRRTHTYNSRFAQELAAWADTRPESPAVHRGLYAAYFVDGRIISDIGTLTEIARAAGLAQEDARVVLTERRFRDAVDADWATASRYGVTGVPSFVAGRRMVVGAQSSDVLDRLVTAAGVLLRQTGGVAKTASISPWPSGRRGPIGSGRSC